MTILPWYVRWLAVLGVLASAMISGAALMYKYEERQYDALAAQFKQFRSDSKTLAAKREAEVAAERLARGAITKKAEVDYEKADNSADARNADVLASLRLDIERLRAAGHELSGVPGAAAVPAGTDVCYDEQVLVDRLQADLGRFLGRLGQVIGRGEKAVNGYELSRIWAQAQHELGKKP